MEREVVFSKEVETGLDELMILLFEKGYFGFPETAKSYVDRMIAFAEQYTGILPGRQAPDYFRPFGRDLKYIIYQVNKQTTWYILYQERNGIYLIRHITNNHVAAKHFSQ
jgi:hypothetical protein